MTREFDEDQSPLWVRSELARVDLIRLVTFSDRDAETTDTVFCFSKQPLIYDWPSANTEFWPVIKELGPLACSINHLPGPDDHSLFRKSWSFTLSNELAGPSQERLINVLRDSHILENARVDWMQLALSERPTTVRIDLTALTGDEHTFWYRGRVRRVGPISQDAITFECEMELPEIEWRVSSDATTTGPDDLGVRWPKVAGEAQKVACVAHDVGFPSTLATAVDAEDTSFVLSYAAGFNTTGTATIGGEVITWTGKSTNTLTGVTRGVGTSHPSNHAAGDLVIEVITTALFGVADHQVDAINDVYAENPYSGQIVRLTTDFTKNVTDTIDGETRASIEFTSTELEEALRELAASPEVTDDGSGPPGTPDQPQKALSEYISGDVYHEYIPSCCDGSDSTHGSLTDSGSGANLYAKFFRPNGGFPQQRIYIRSRRWGASSGGTIYIYKGRYGIDTTTLLGSLSITSDWEWQYVDTEEDAEWVTFRLVGSSVELAISDVMQYVNNTQTSTHQQASYCKRDTGGSESGPQSWCDENDGTGQSIQYDDWIGVRFSPQTFDTQIVRLLCDNLSGYNWNMYIRDSDYEYGGTKLWPSAIYEWEPQQTVTEMYFETALQGNYFVLYNEDNRNITVYEMSRNYVTYADPPEPSIKIAGASVGYGLKLFADVDGYEVPSGASPAYKAGAAGTLMKFPCDILRYLIEEIGGESIDTDSYDDCYTNLGAGSGVEMACDLRTMGLNWPDIIARIAFENRISLIPEETTSGRTWKMLTASTAYTFPTATSSVTEWEPGGFVEVGRALGDELATSFKFYYAPDWTRGDSDQAFAAILIANEEDNDLTSPTLAEFTTATTNFGNVEAQPIAFRCLYDSDSAKNVAGYYAHELIRGGALFAITGVPWWEGYNLEVGDIINVTPPWTDTPVKCRLIEYVKDPATEQIELRLVEVE